MSWIERTTKKRIKALDEHPELNSNDFEQKGNTLMKNIKFYVILIIATALVLALWYEFNHPEIHILPRIL
mgnify:FL=1